MWWWLQIVHFISCILISLMVIEVFILIIIMRTFMHTAWLIAQRLLCSDLWSQKSVVAGYNISTSRANLFQQPLKNLFIKQGYLKFMSIDFYDLNSRNILSILPVKTMLREVKFPTFWSPYWRRHQECWELGKTSWMTFSMKV